MGGHAAHRVTGDADADTGVQVADERVTGCGVQRDGPADDLRDVPRPLTPVDASEVGVVGERRSGDDEAGGDQPADLRRVAVGVAVHPVAPLDDGDDTIGDGGVAHRFAARCAGDRVEDASVQPPTAAAPGEVPHSHPELLGRRLGVGRCDTEQGHSGHSCAQRQERAENGTSSNRHVDSSCDDGGGAGGGAALRGTRARQDRLAVRGCRPTAGGRWRRDRRRCQGGAHRAVIVRVFERRPGNQTIRSMGAQQAASTPLRHSVSMSWQKITAPEYEMSDRRRPPSWACSAMAPTD